MKRIITTAALFLPLASPALAGYDEGVAAYRRGDYFTAFWELRPLAEQGHAGAQNGLGVMYVKGQGVKRDDSEALKWYTRAAEQGLAKAQFNLGLMYGRGRGVRQDDAEAVKWYKRAAEQGLARAQTGLGLMYANGWGVPQDTVQAHKWFNLAASGGETVARRHRDTIATRLTPDQIADAQTLARQWWTAHRKDR